MGNATMHDVAKLAGVSLATVGRVLHKNGYVSQENREKVEAAVKALGYIPNSAAQLLKNSCSRMLGHILHFSPNLLFGQISRGVDRAAAERGYSVLSFTKYGSPGEDQRIVTEFISRRVEGVLITSLQEFDQGLLDKLLDAGIPTVRIERAPPGADRVMVDDFQGAYQGARSLVEAGHKHIAFIGVGGDSRVERLRLLGYRKALEEGGISPSPRLERLVADYTPQEGYRAMEALWRHARPTAVFAGADTLASGALQYLYQVGARVPEDLSSAGVRQHPGHPAGPAPGFGGHTGGGHGPGGSGSAAPAKAAAPGPRGAGRGDPGPRGTGDQRHGGPAPCGTRGNLRHVTSKKERQEPPWNR